jgi:response regulator RpfG family c-di-GMP phosphodiesterase
MAFGRTRNDVQSEIRVLLVEEEADLLEWMTAVLSPWYRPIPCRSAQRALALLDSATRFDMLVTAYGMLEMTGCELHRRVARVDLMLARNALLIVAGRLTAEDERYVDSARLRVIHQPFRGDRLRQETHTLATRAALSALGTLSSG